MGIHAMNEAQAKRMMLANKLTAGNVSQEERDEALSILLLSIWSDDDLEKTIEDTHNRLCDHCPVKMRYEHEQMTNEAKESKKSESTDFKNLVWKILLVGALALSTALSVIANLTKTPLPAVE